MKSGCSVGGDGVVEFRQGCGGVVERRRRQETKRMQRKMGGWRRGIQEGFWVGQGCWSATWLLSRLPQSPLVCIDFAGKSAFEQVGGPMQARVEWLNTS